MIGTSGYIVISYYITSHHHWIIHHCLVPTTFADRTVGRFGNSIPGKFCRPRVVLRQLPLLLLLRGHSSLLLRRLGSNLSDTACSIIYCRSFGWFSTCSRGGSAESSFRISSNTFGCDLGVSGEDVWARQTLDQKLQPDKMQTNLTRMRQQCKPWHDMKRSLASNFSEHAFQLFNVWFDAAFAFLCTFNGCRRAALKRSCF